MKKTLLNSMSYVDEQLIAEAEAQPAAKKRPAWVKWGSVAACFCLIAGGAVLAAKMISKPVPKIEPTVESSVPYVGDWWTEGSPDDTHTDDDVLSESASSTAATSQAGNDEGFGEWEGKEVQMSLAEALENAAADDRFAIVARSVPDDDFVFEGKTLGEYCLEMAEEMNRPEKCLMLYKCGDQLKYGEKLYTEGTPDGERWAKELYEETIEFYGEELLNQYIVNGEFLGEQLLQDIDAYTAKHEAQDAYAQAEQAYYEQLAQNMSANLQAEAADNAVILHTTKADFAAFVPQGEDWWFSWAVDGQQLHDDEAVVSLDCMDE